MADTTLLPLRHRPPNLGLYLWRLRSGVSPCRATLTRWQCRWPSKCGPASSQGSFSGPRWWYRARVTPASGSNLVRPTPIRKRIASRSGFQKCSRRCSMGRPRCIAARDEFTEIKCATRDDMLAMLRVPSQLLEIAPQNSGGPGSIRDAATVWIATERSPLRTRTIALNEWLEQEVIRFGPFELASAVA